MYGTRTRTETCDRCGVVMKAHPRIRPLLPGEEPYPGEEPRWRDKQRCAFCSGKAGLYKPPPVRANVMDAAERARALAFGQREPEAKDAQRRLAQSRGAWRTGWRLLVLGLGAIWESLRVRLGGKP